MRRRIREEDYCYLPDMCPLMEAAQEQWGTGMRDNPRRMAEVREMREVLDDVLDTLPPRNADMIRRRFFAMETLKEAGASQGIQRNSARVREHRALRQLRHESRTAMLRGVCPFRTAADRRAK
jgi:RNA polymerase sigma factor (sigma-70 family)